MSTATVPIISPTSALAPLGIIACRCLTDRQIKSGLQQVGCELPFVRITPAQSVAAPIEQLLRWRSRRQWVKAIAGHQRTQPLAGLVLVNHSDCRCGGHYQRQVLRLARVALLSRIHGLNVETLWVFHSSNGQVKAEMLPRGPQTSEEYSPVGLDPHRDLPTRNWTDRWERSFRISA